MKKKKVKACRNALKYLPKEGVIGIGAGSTIELFLEQINNKKLRMVCASKRIEEKARSLGFKISPLNKRLNISFDGADWVDKNKNLIKGYGACLYKEKVIDYNSKKVVIITDKSKFCDSFSGLDIPVETNSFSTTITRRRLEQMGFSTSLMKKKTEQGNKIILCKAKRIINPKEVEQKLKLIPGVVEVGLFSKKNVMVVSD